MTDWLTYWNIAPAGHAETDYLGQVGKTVHGQPVAEGLVDLMVADIVAHLALTPSDRVLDLCCGNGLITSRCASLCHEITGVDFSQRLIDVANTHFARPNVLYVVGDVRERQGIALDRKFSKIYMYEALQYFDACDVTALLDTLQAVPSSMAPLFVASIPDAARKWHFYNTPALRDEYARRASEGTEALGHWWTRTELTGLATRCGYDIAFFDPHPHLHVAHYRFDALLTPQARSSG
jgi:2-polyprenyl-3-methyl-5-hydroxy-6-metoxy-1,4-benzoquinol methylase